jgi:hypothetical protein
MGVRHRVPRHTLIPELSVNRNPDWIPGALFRLRRWRATKEAPMWVGMQSSCPEGCDAEVRLVVRGDSVIKTDRIALVHNNDGSHTVTLIPRSDVYHRP